MDSRGLDGPLASRRPEDLPTFKAYDKKGNNIGDCLANTNSIDAKGSWKFEAACLKKGVAKVTFKEVTGG